MQIKLSGIRKKRVFLVTTLDMAEDTIQYIQNNRKNNCYIIGMAVTDLDVRGSKIAGVHVNVYDENISDFLKREWVDEVYIHLKECEQSKRIIHDMLEMGITSHNIKSENLLTADSRKEQTFQWSDETISISRISPGQAFLRRTGDIIGGVFGCIITGVLCIIVGPLIYVQSHGSIFYLQERIGKNGRKFKMYKFRSMYPNADEEKDRMMAENMIKGGYMFKMEWDPRIIGSRKLPDGSVKKGIGNYIREWSIDEFPQFFNVLKGDMSLVGTRPPTVDEWNLYEPRHRVRLAIKPGITGLWQVSGRNNITDFEKVLALDKKYIRERSCILDLKILLKTIVTVLSRDGAR